MLRVYITNTFIYCITDVWMYFSFLIPCSVLYYSPEIQKCESRVRTFSNFCFQYKLDKKRLRLWFTHQHDSYSRTSSWDTVCNQAGVWLYFMNNCNCEASIKSYCIWIMILIPLNITIETMTYFTGTALIKKNMYKKISHNRNMVKIIVFNILVFKLWIN